MRDSEAVVWSAGRLDSAVSVSRHTKDGFRGTLITAHSNLPDSAELMGSFYAGGGAYFTQDTAALVNGVAAFGPFSDDRTPLNCVHELSITLPIARNQPDAVQECIGEAGEFITGPLVSREEITGDQVASLDVIVTIDWCGESPRYLERYPLRIFLRWPHVRTS